MGNHVFVLAWHNTRLNDSGVTGVFRTMDAAKSAAWEADNGDYPLEERAPREEYRWEHDASKSIAQCEPPGTDVAWFVTREEVQH